MRAPVRSVSDDFPTLARPTVPMIPRDSMLAHAIFTLASTSAFGFIPDSASRRRLATFLLQLLPPYHSQSFRL